MKEIDSIPDIEKQYKDEWLLFEVYETDQMNQPIRGKLLIHSPSRKALNEYWHRIKVKFPYITYTGKKLPEKMEIVL
ncbi:hypothetical protein KAX29_05640 [candidate division WOR-3 bacterium]|nr:hypothetical protein [candidate division WOR-3 bacterium]